MEQDDTLKRMLELRSEIIALASVVVQIHSVLATVRPHSPDIAVQEFDKRMDDLSQRTEKFLDMLGKDSFNG